MALDEEGTELGLILITDNGRWASDSGAGISLSWSVTLISVRALTVPPLLDARVSFASPPIWK